MTDTEREQLRLILQLQAKVAALEDENTALKAKVADLQKRLDDLAGRTRYDREACVRCDASVPHPVRVG